ncbi:MAG: 5-oxoprolinase subunit PxpB [Vicinamibacterales bacterium]
MIRDAGESALVLELEPRIDAAVNARAIAIGASVRGEGIAGVRDVVSTYRSVAVFFDPLQTRLEAVTAALGRAAREPGRVEASRIVEVLVAYGGENGPDLQDVAGETGLSEAEIIRRHAAEVYRVFMLGFVPGFAYLGILDPSIAVPRRATPRVRVPAGSVAIAGRQTGIYPQETPGGWRLIGRTRVRPFDPSRTPQFLVEAGDHVRFVPVASLDDTGPAPAAAPPAAQGSAGGLVVLRPGMLTTVQDLGRWGYQDRGVPVAGPMDAVAHRLANAAVGNAVDAATLEVTLIGPELRFEEEAMIAVAGADLGATLDSVAIPPCTAVRAPSGATLRFSGRRTGSRAYVAVGGGLDVPRVLGSRATHVLSAMGGHRGRPLVAGDRLPLARRAAVSAPSRPAPARAVATGGVRLRVLPGPQEDDFGESGLEILQRTRFTVSPQSNRMAYRLTGGTIPRATDREMISDATCFGGIQVPPSGEPILLMADRQTSGGYPQVATVVAADLPLAGQLAPGDWVEFRVCSRREALAALIAQEGQLLAGR